MSSRFLAGLITVVACAGLAISTLARRGGGSDQMNEDGAPDGKVTKHQKRQDAASSPGRGSLGSGTPNGSSDRRGEMRSEIVGRPLSEWIGKIESYTELDPSFCADLIKSIPNESERNQALQLLAQYWGKRDFDAAMAWMSANFAKEHCLALRQYLVAGLIQGDPQRAKEVVLQTEAPYIKQQLSLMLVHELFSRSPSDAESWAIQSLSPVQASLALEMMGREWMKDGNLNEAIRLSSKMAYGLSRNNLLASIGEEYAKSDLSASLKWFDSLDRDEKALVQPYIMATWASSDPRKAAEFALSHGGQIEAMGSVLSTWAATSPTDAASWIQENYGSGKGAMDLYGRVFQQWGTTNPEAAAAYVAELPQGKEREYYLTLITSSWLGRDPATAGEFLGKMKGVDSAGAIELLVKGWSSLDSMSASKWVSSLEQGPGYDVACASLAETVMVADPRGAAQWASSIGQASTRQATLKKVFEGLGAQIGPEALNVAGDLGLNQQDQKLVEDAVARGVAKK